MPSLYIDGKWTAGSGGSVDVLNPFDGSVVEAVDQAGPDDVAAAVAAARAAFDDPRGWRATPVDERAGVLRRVADLLQRDREHIARVETLDTGKTLGESRIDVDDVTAVFRYYADIAVAQEGRTVDVGQPHVLSRIAHEPVGVCALITPWNYPLLQLSWKLAPALVAGCTCVIKPSEVTPLTSVLLVRLVEEAGVPPGVVNILLGTGPAVGAPLTAHPDVDMVSFTGGLATGQAIIRASAETVKRVAVELGGKNPNIVFADAADNGGFETVVDNALTAVFLHSGPGLLGGRAADRRGVGRGRARRRAGHAGGRDPDRQRARPGQPDRPAGLRGAPGQDRGLRRVGPRGGRPGAVGRVPPRRPGARQGLLLPPHRARRLPPRHAGGARGDVRPAAHRGALRRRGEAIALGNDTTYGLAGAVWTRDAARAHRVAGALRHGTVWINDFGPYVPGAEWGGMKRSGNGRELGPTGLHEYQEQKHIWHNTAPAPARWFT